MSHSFRRKILYIPGFDPIPPRRYRELFRRESAKQGRISDYRINMSPKGAAGRKFGWDCTGSFGSEIAQSRFDVLVWDDLVQHSMRRGILGTYVQLVTTSWTYIASGALWRLMKLRRGPVLAALYPIAVLLVQLLLGLIAGLVAGWYPGIWMGWWLGLAIGMAVLWLTLAGFRRLDNRIFAYYLMHDYAFTAQNRGAYPPMLEKRLAEFSRHLEQCLNEDLDEVLVVGHSSGAYLAVSLLADTLRRRPVPPDGPKLALLTLGHVVPMASFLPNSHRLRGDLSWLSQSPQLFWLDVTAPGDACCFGLCDPVAVTGVDAPNQKWPLVISAAFTQTLSPETLRKLRYRWFRLHFQYLCAFDRPNDYDYFAITAGPQTLAQRFQSRDHSPGRITIPAGRGLAS
ncbi:hypothetical protein PAF17_15230 [Paracoccus sp. Z330]|uniref:Uncharacterized protein n=1 Tax=Paracoccus onchidii TaxID=3017813 RepID=A0ABT4ZHR0_9RHOB|nr:hypothetical protein [Paracoccus onchidii]MDB6178848.1 hypothetical protein [Paracoccus onchidii]